MINIHWISFLSWVCCNIIITINKIRAERPYIIMTPTDQGRSEGGQNKDAVQRQDKGASVLSWFDFGPST